MKIQCDISSKPSFDFIVFETSSVDKMKSYLFSIRASMRKAHSHKLKKSWNKTFSAISKKKEKERCVREKKKRKQFNRYNRPLFIFIAFAINSINNPQNWKRQELFLRWISIQGKTFSPPLFSSCTSAMIEKLRLCFPRLSFVLLSVYHSLRSLEFAAGCWMVEWEVICW